LPPPPPRPTAFPYTTLFPDNHPILDQHRPHVVDLVLLQVQLSHHLGSLELPAKITVEHRQNVVLPILRDRQRHQLRLLVPRRPDPDGALLASTPRHRAA